MSHTHSMTPASWPPAALQAMLFYTPANLSFPFCCKWLSFGLWLLGKAFAGRAAFWAAHSAAVASFSSTTPACQTAFLPHYNVSLARFLSSWILDKFIILKRHACRAQLHFSCTWNIAFNIQNHDFYHAKPTPYSTRKICNIPATLHALSEKPSS